MKKSLIVLAIASAFAAPAAFAEATLYGNVGVSVGSVNSGTNGATATQVSSNASMIGVKGSEDLGGGTSAIWQIESYVNLNNNNPTDSQASGLSSGDSFAGLSGSSWGTVILGQHDTPYKISTRNLDMFADTIADNRSLMGPLDGTDRLHVPNVIAYISPSFSGVTIAAAYVAGASIPNTKTTTKGDAYSLAGMYTAGPINVDLAYQSLTYGGATTGLLDYKVLGGAFTPVYSYSASAPAANDKTTAWKLAASYSVDQFAVNGIYEHNDYSPATGSSTTINSYYFAGKYNVTVNDAVKLAYTHVGNPSGASSATAKQTSVGYDHSMSKHTSVYVLYTKVSEDAGHETTLGGFDGINATVAGNGFGAGPSAWGIGMKHAF